MYFTVFVRRERLFILKLRFRHVPPPFLIFSSILPLNSSLPPKTLTSTPIYRMTEEEELELSALKIQSIARGRKARRGNRRVKSPKKALATEEDLAAAKLQSMQRGKNSRKRVEEIREQKAAAGRIQAIHRGRADRRVVEAEKKGGLELEVKDVRKVRRRG